MIYAVKKTCRNAIEAQGFKLPGRHCLSRKNLFLEERTAHTSESVKNMACLRKSKNSKRLNIVMKLGL